MPRSRMLEKLCGTPRQRVVPEVRVRKKVTADKECAGPPLPARVVERGRDRASKILCPGSGPRSSWIDSGVPGVRQSDDTRLGKTPAQWRMQRERERIREIHERSLERCSRVEAYKQRVSAHAPGAGHALSAIEHALNRRCCGKIQHAVTRTPSLMSSLKELSRRPVAIAFQALFSVEYRVEDFWLFDFGLMTARRAACRMGCTWRRGRPGTESAAKLFCAARRFFQAERGLTVNQLLVVPTGGPRGESERKFGQRLEAVENTLSDHETAILEFERQEHVQVQSRTVTARQPSKKTKIHTLSHPHL